MGKSNVLVYLSLGSNVGQREDNILSAVRMMEAHVGELVAMSSLLETKPWGFHSDNLFVNAAAAFLTALSAEELLRRTQEIERQLGRTHKSVNREYHDRTIDIDILLYGREIIGTPTLQVPHPLMLQRDFVMDPLREIITEEDLQWLKSVNN